MANAELSALHNDIATIIEPYKDQYYVPTISIETILHTEHKNLNHTDGVVLKALNIHRDYVNSIADYMELELMINPGTFLYHIYPYLDNIEITLIKEKQVKGEGSPFYTTKYKAVFLLDKNINIPTNLNISHNDLSNMSPFLIHFQLLDRSAETLRIKSLQGNFSKKINNNKNMKIDNFLQSVISEHANKILIENKPSLSMINIEPPSNKEDINSLNLGSSTYLINLPNYIHEKVQGVYTAGLGTYIQRYKDDIGLFVYSLYNGLKYKKATKKINLYIPPSGIYMYEEVTYKYKDDLLRIVTQPSPVIQDIKDTRVLSQGTGVRTSNANSFMKKPIEPTANGPVFNRSRLNTEITQSNRSDNLNFAVKPRNAVTSNIFYQTSIIKQNEARYIDLKWTNGDPYLIYPGAACKLFYENKDNKVEERYGVINHVFIQYVNTNASPILTSNIAKNTVNVHCLLKVYLEKEGVS